MGLRTEAGVRRAAGWFPWAAVVAITLAVGAAAAPAQAGGTSPTSASSGLWVASADGAVRALGGARHLGDRAGRPLNAPIVDIEAVPGGGGYWLLGRDGGVFSYGRARFHGSTGGRRLNEPVVGIAADPVGRGYWFVASDGGVFAFGVPFHGSMGGRPLNAPVVDMEAAPLGDGYLLVASDGGTFAFGGVRFWGNPLHLGLRQPVVGIANHPSGEGYWIVDAGGGVYAFGAAPFLGSLAGRPPPAAVTGIVPTASGEGYWLVDAAGGVHAFGDAAPFVAAAATAGGTFVAAAAENPAVADSGHRILTSDRADRSGAVPLDGLTVTGDIFAFVDPASGLSKVRFFIDDPDRSGPAVKVENKAPWDLAGGKRASANPFDTTTLADGTHTLTAELTLSEGGTAVVPAGFDVANTAPRILVDPDEVTLVAEAGGAPVDATVAVDTSDGTAAGFSTTVDVPWLSVAPTSGTTPATVGVTADPATLGAGTHTGTVTVSSSGRTGARVTVTVEVTTPVTETLVRSATPDRADPAPLEGATLAGDAYVFVSPDDDVDRVEFFIDDPAMTGSPHRIENHPPYDLAGGSAGAANPFDTTTLSDGTHTLTARVRRYSGEIFTLSATFTVDNVTGGFAFDPGTVELSAESFGDPEHVSFTVGTTDGSAGSYTLSTDVPWLSVSPASGTTPAPVTATVDPSGLDVGTHVGTVTATGAGRDPATLTVTVTVVNECQPLACSAILVDLPYVVDWSTDFGGVLDGDGDGTGFTMVDFASRTDPDYLPVNLDADPADGGTLAVTTTSGLQYQAVNRLQNALGVGVDVPSQVALIETTIAAVPPLTEGFEQAGLWFGTDEDNYIKLVVVSRPDDGTRVEMLMEIDGVAVESTSPPAPPMTGEDVHLTLRVDPFNQTVRGHYNIGDGPDQVLGTFQPPEELFSFDAAGINPRIGTRSFAGIFASHRNAAAPVTFRFREFSIQPAAAGVGPATFPFDRTSFEVPMPTAMAWGPDGRLYVAEALGTIHAVTLDAAGAVVDDEVITTIGTRLTLGLTVDPESTPDDVVLWVAHSDPAFSHGAANSSTVTRLSGPGFAERTDVIVGLPRAEANHAINHIHFGPDGRLYIAMGGNTGAGAPNTENDEFGTRPEQPLSAAVVVADVRDPDFDGTCANDAELTGPPPCDVTVWASGLRNTYDFVFHRNGHVYGPDNGLGVAGSFPPSPAPPCDGFGDTRPVSEGGHNPGPQNDVLNLLEEGRYYGHPNPSRGECVFKDGSLQGVPPPAGWTPPIFDLGAHRSTNGIIEYTNADAFCGALDGDLLMTNYSVGDDITRVVLSEDGRSVELGERLIGGFNDPLPITQAPDGRIFVGEFGGNRVTVLTPVDGGCWTAGPAAEVALLDAGGDAIGDRLYVVGGKTDTGHRSELRIFDATTGTWTTGADLPGPAVENPAVVAHDGALYVFGGSTGPFSGAVDTAHRYDPSTGTWTALAPMPTARGGAAAVAADDGTIWVIGGMGADGASLATVEIYDPVTDTWTAGTPLAVRRDNPAAGNVDGVVVVVGGRTRNADGSVDDPRLTSAERWDPAAGTWVAAAPMPTGRRTAVGVALAGRLHVIGGEGGGSVAFAEHEAYDPATDTWRTLSPVPTPRHGAAGGVIAGRIHVVGGGPLSGTSFTDAHEIFSFD